MTNEEVRLAIKSWLPVLLWMGFIFVMSTDVGSADHTSHVLEPIVRWINPHASAEEFSLVHFLVRKTAHVTEYAILAVLIFRGVRLSLGGNFGRWSPRAAGAALIGSLVYAAADEFHQSFNASRTSSAGDVMIDFCGATAAIIIVWMVAKLNRTEAKS